MNGILKVDKYKLMTSEYNLMTLENKIHFLKKMKIEKLNNTFSTQNIKILKQDLISLERVKRIYERYGDKVPVYPMKGISLLNMMKILEILNVKFRITDQNQSPLYVDTDIWGKNNSILIFQFDKPVEESYEFV